MTIDGLKNKIDAILAISFQLDVVTIENTKAVISEYDGSVNLALKTLEEKKLAYNKPEDYIELLNKLYEQENYSLVRDIAKAFLANKAPLSTLHQVDFENLKENAIGKLNSQKSLLLSPFRL